MIHKGPRDRNQIKKEQANEANGMSEYGYDWDFDGNGSSKFTLLDLCTPLDTPKMSHMPAKPLPLLEITSWWKK